MKKITAIFFAFMLIGFASKAQTSQKANTSATKKLTTKNKTIKAVNSPKTSEALKKAQTDKRKEGE